MRCLIPFYSHCPSDSHTLDQWLIHIALSPSKFTQHTAVGHSTTEQRPKVRKSNHLLAHHQQPLFILAGAFSDPLYAAKQAVFHRGTNIHATCTCSGELSPAKIEPTTNNTVLNKQTLHYHSLVLYKHSDVAMAIQTSLGKEVPELNHNSLLLLATVPPTTIPATNDRTEEGGSQVLLQPLPLVADS